MKLLSGFLVASTAIISPLAAAGGSSTFPPAFQGFWEEEPMVCDPADGEGIGTMNISGGDFVETSEPIELVDLTVIAPDKVRVLVSRISWDSEEAQPDPNAPPTVEIWTLKDKGQRIHVETLDQAGKRISTRERYRCQAQ